MKKLTTAKIWQFAAGQFGWAMLSGIISNWLVYFYQPDKTAISQGQTVFIPQGLVVLGIYDQWRNYSVWKNFRCIYRSYDCILV